MRLVAWCLLCIVIVAGSAVQSAQAEDKMVYAASATSKFANLPGTPQCIKASVANGDPEKGPSVLLAKGTPGCKVPWHWHTPNEQVMIISGQGKLEMKGAKPMLVHSADYLSLSSKQAHQFTCLSACTMFISADAVFDIHYVDASGKEVPAEEALKSQAKAPAHRAPAKTD